DELVVDEVVFGEPDLIEAQLLRPLHLLELAVNDLGVGERRRGLKKKKKKRRLAAPPSRRRIACSTSRQPACCPPPRSSEPTDAPTSAGHRSAHRLSRRAPATARSPFGGTAAAQQVAESSHDFDRRHKGSL